MSPFFCENFRFLYIQTNCLDCYSLPKTKKLCFFCELLHRLFNDVLFHLPYHRLTRNLKADHIQISNNLKWLFINFRDKVEWIKIETACITWWPPSNALFDQKANPLVLPGRLSRQCGMSWSNRRGTGFQIFSELRL